MGNLFAAQFVCVGFHSFQGEGARAKSTVNFCLRRPGTFRATVIGHLSLVISEKKGNWKVHLIGGGCQPLSGLPKAFNNKKFLGGGLNQSVSGSVGQLDDGQAPPGSPLIMMPRHHTETNENQHQRFAQHIGSPRRGAAGGKDLEFFFIHLLTLSDIIPNIFSHEKTIFRSA